MKKIFLVIMLISLLVVNKVSAAGRPTPVDENETFYKSCKNVDQKTYKIIGGSYGKDKNGIYFGCDKVPVKDIKTFELINTDKVGIYYAKDFHHIYQGSNIISSDVKNFRFLDEQNPWFALDSNNLFCRGTSNVIKGIDSKNIAFMDKDGKPSYKEARYISDGKKIIIIPDGNCKEIVGADASSRKYISGDPDYSKDKNHIYYGINALPNVDIASRTHYNEAPFYSKDKNQIYFQDKVLLGYKPLNSNIYNINGYDILSYKNQKMKYILFNR